MKVNAKDYEVIKSNLQNLIKNRFNNNKELFKKIISNLHTGEKSKLKVDKFTATLLLDSFVSDLLEKYFSETGAYKTPYTNTNLITASLKAVKELELI